MAKYILDRRRFIARSGQAIMVVAASGSAMFTDTARSWAITLEKLDTHEGQTLLRMCRLLYPHDQIEDLHYATVVEALDAEAAASRDVAMLLGDGVVSLDQARGKFVSLHENSQIRVLEAMQESAFFQKVRGAVIYHLYNNPLVWPAFGYQGSSYEHGGYLDRGFQDAGWLAEPPEEASPPAFRG